MSQFNRKKRSLRRSRLLFFRHLRDYFSPFMESLRHASNRVKLAIAGGMVGVIALLVLCVSLFGKNGAGTGTAHAMSLSANAEADGIVQIEITPTPVSTIALSPTPTPDPTLRKGVEGEAVQQLQQRLMELGFLELDEPTQLYGPATRAAVRLFQRQINFSEELGLKLDEDGVAGEQTLALIYGENAPKYVAKEGMEGDDITSMQVQLKDMGYMSETTGYYGEKTIAAIKEFQGRNGLSADGLAGVKTYELLYSPNAKESASKAHEARSKANISKMIEIAKDKVGSPYVLGSTGPSKFDCSGLVYYCLKEAGSNRRRLTAAGYSQVDDWEKITSMSKLKKGDLIFFYNNGFSKVGHVGIIISSGMMIDASSANGKVVRRSFSTSYWREHFVCGRRPW
ncbi:MAG: peptidoglycan-binding protein [Candidatus Pelethousia sp.]|nr:peptidoglycan-binding protein [Candidatus Pelethousia sp.]